MDPKSIGHARQAKLRLTTKAKYALGCRRPTRQIELPTKRRSRSSPRRPQSPRCLFDFARISGNAGVRNNLNFAEACVRPARMRNRRSSRTPPHLSELPSRLDDALCQHSAGRRPQTARSAGPSIKSKKHVHRDQRTMTRHLHNQSVEGKSATSFSELHQRCRLRACQRRCRMLPHPHRHIFGRRMVASPLTATLRFHLDERRGAPVAVSVGQTRVTLGGSDPLFL
jgi:hypothetical protein